MSSLGRREFLEQSVGMTAGLVGPQAARNRSLFGQGGPPELLCPQYIYMQYDGQYYYYCLNCPSGTPSGLVHTDPNLKTQTGCADPERCLAEMARWKLKPVQEPPKVQAQHHHHGTKLDIHEDIKADGIATLADPTQFPHMKIKNKLAAVISEEICKITVKARTFLVKLVLLNAGIRPNPPLVSGIGLELASGTPTFPKNDPYDKIIKVARRYMTLEHPTGPLFHVLTKENIP